MKPTIYGYVRVSTAEQNEDRQLIALREMGVPKKNIFMDKLSSKDFRRPGRGFALTQFAKITKDMRG